MNRFNTQFYALLPEHMAFILNVLENYPVFAAAICPWPGQRFDEFPFDASSIDKVAENIAEYNVIIFNLEGPVNVTKPAFTDEYPDCLILRIGKETSSTVEETSLGTISFDDQALKVWHSINRRLKKKYKTGGTFLNTDTGSQMDAGSIRFSDGVREKRTSSDLIVTPNINMPKYIYTFDDELS